MIQAYRCIGGPLAGEVLRLPHHLGCVRYEKKAPAQKVWTQPGQLQFTKHTTVRVARYSLHDTADGIHLALFQGYEP